METVNISTFKATCLDLLERVKRTGQPLLILKRGEPIAQVIPPPQPVKLESWLGSFKETGTIPGDVILPVVDEKEWEILGS